MNNRRLLMISTDRKIFEEGSEVRARQIEYAKDWDEVHIIVFAKRNFQFPIHNLQSSSNCKLPNETALSTNCFAYSTRSRSKLQYPFDAINLGRFIIEKRGITDITCQDASLTAMAGCSLKKEFAGRGKDLRLEIQVHEDIGSPRYGFNMTNKIRKMLAFKYIPQADYIRVVSNRIKDFIISTLNPPAGGDNSKIEVRPIIVDTESIKNAPVLPAADLHKKYPQFEKIVLIAGRLEPEKNVKLAIATWPLIIEKLPKAGLIIVGDGSQFSSLNAQCSKLAINSSVIFEKWVDHNTLISYYKTADLFLNTSLFEGYGMALVEAKAAGCMVVSTDVGVAKEIGAVIAEHDKEDISTKIIDNLIK